MATERATSREGEKKLQVKCATCNTGRRDGLGNMNNEPKENSVDERGMNEVSCTTYKKGRPDELGELKQRSEAKQNR